MGYVTHRLDEMDTAVSIVAYDLTAVREMSTEMSGTLEATLSAAKTSLDVANRHDVQFATMNTSIAQIADQLQWCVNQVYIMMNTVQGFMSNMNGGMLGKFLTKGLNGANSESL
jgi:hypothetical protein